MNPMVRVCLVLQEITKLFSRVAVQFCLPTSNDKCSCCSTSFPAFAVVNVLDTGRPNRYEGEASVSS